MEIEERLAETLLCQPFDCKESLNILVLTKWIIQSPPRFYIFFFCCYLRLIFSTYHQKKAAGLFVCHTFVATIQLMSDNATNTCPYDATLKLAALYDLVYRIFQYFRIHTIIPYTYNVYYVFKSIISIYQFKPLHKMSTSIHLLFMT